MAKSDNFFGMPQASQSWRTLSTPARAVLVAFLGRFVARIDTRVRKLGLLGPKQ